MRRSVVLTIGVPDPVAVKTGFASGYGGGPSVLLYVNSLMEAHNVEIEE